MVSVVAVPHCSLDESLTVATPKNPSKSNTLAVSRRARSANFSLHATLKTIFGSRNLGQAVLVSVVAVPHCSLDESLTVATPKNPSKSNTLAVSRRARSANFSLHATLKTIFGSRNLGHNFMLHQLLIGTSPHDRISPCVTSLRNRISFLY